MACLLQRSQHQTPQKRLAIPFFKDVSMVGLLPIVVAEEE
jgi:hypothetical protein